MTRWLAFFAVLSLVACAASLQKAETSAGQNATQGAIERVVADTPQLADAGASISGAAASAVVQQLTGPRAQAGVKALVDTSKNELLSPETHDYLVSLAADMADAAVSRLNDAIQKDALIVKSDADLELPRLERTLYLVLAVIGGLVVLLAGITVYEGYKHRKVLERLTNGSDVQNQG